MTGNQRPLGPIYARTSVRLVRAHPSIPTMHHLRAPARAFRLGRRAAVSNRLQCDVRPDYWAKMLVVALGIHALAAATLYLEQERARHERHLSVWSSRWPATLVIDR